MEYKRQRGSYEYKLRNNIFLKDKLARLKYQQIKLKLRLTLSYFMKVFKSKSLLRKLRLDTNFIKNLKNIEIN